MGSGYSTILNVINDAELRKVIKIARNRTESYHQLQRALRKIGSGVYKGRRTIDNQVSCQATRLVSNFIIAYNATLLNGVYLQMIKQYGQKMAQSIMTKISPVAWPHIIFFGRYVFKHDADGVELQKIVAELTSHLQKSLL